MCDEPDPHTRPKTIPWITLINLTLNGHTSFEFQTRNYIVFPSLEFKTFEC